MHPIIFRDGYRLIECNGLVYDQRNGAGAVYDLENLEYLGFLTLMRPSDFLRLCPLLEGPRPGDVATFINTTSSMAIPFLGVQIGGQADRVRTHEGRHRMHSIRLAYGDIEVPVAVFPREGMRAHDIGFEDIARIANGVIAEAQFGGQFISGPLFETAYHLGIRVNPYGASEVLSTQSFTI